MVVQKFQEKHAEEILDSSPAALTGLSDADADHLHECLGIKTVRDLADNRFFLRAQAVLHAAGVPSHDPGPPADWEQFFSSAPLDHYIHHVSERFRLDFGPVYYRGRLDGTARIIIVGQDPSTNEILAHRIFVGRSGQRIQGFLKKLGLTRSYAMLNTFLYSVYGQFNTELRNISLEGPVLSYRNGYLDRIVEESPIQAVVGVGNGGYHAVDNWPGGEGIPRFKITHPAAMDEDVLLETWNGVLAELRSIVEPDDGVQPDPAPYGESFTSEDLVAIPQHDLPFGVPDWHGVGPHSKRDGVGSSSRTECRAWSIPRNRCIHPWRSNLRNSGVSEAMRRPRRRSSDTSGRLPPIHSTTYMCSISSLRRCASSLPTELICATSGVRERAPGSTSGLVVSFLLPMGSLRFFR
jgi:hypothetical protein